MTEAIPPNQGAALAAALATRAGATVVEAPAALRALASATLLDAIVIARDSGGLVSLKTDAGTVVLRGAAQLAPGASVTLQLPPSGGDQVVIAPAPTRAAAAPSAAPQVLDPPPRVGGAVTLTATVLAPAPTRTPAELAASDRAARPGGETAPTAMRGAYQTVTVEPPVAGAKPTAPTATATTETAAAARPASGGEASLADKHADSFSPAARASDIRGDFARLAQRAPTATPPVPTPASPPPGATVELRLAPPASPPANPAERPLPATVIDRTPSGQTLLDTPIGRLAASLPAELAAARPGARLLFLWQPPETAAAPPPTPAREFAPLRHALAALVDSPDPEAREAAQRALPRPGPALARQLMEFVEAAERGARRWLGEAAASTLERAGGAETLRQLDSSLRDAARQPAAADWRHVVIPFADGPLLRPIDVWARRQKGRERDGRPRDQSRFVVECAHEAWGELQIDGLMTEAAEGSRLDVVMRTHAELPASLRAELAVGFADALGAMGVAGDIAFQAVAAFPPRPAAAPARAVTA